MRRIYDRIHLSKISRMRQVIKYSWFGSILIQFTLIYSMIGHKMLNCRCETSRQFSHAIAASSILFWVQDFIYKPLAKFDMSMRIVNFCAKGLIHIVWISSGSLIKAVQKLRYNLLSLLLIQGVIYIIHLTSTFERTYYSHPRYSLSSPLCWLLSLHHL